MQCERVELVNTMYTCMCDLVVVAQVVSLLRAPGRDAAGELPEVDSIADVTGRTHASTAAALKFEAYKGFGGGRPSNFPLSAGEVGDWSTASSHGVEVAGIQDTTVTEIEEQRGIVSTAAHIAQALRDARPVVIRAGAANAQYATDYKKMTRSALGSVSESFDCQPGLDLNALALDALVSSLPGLMSTPRKSICRAEQVSFVLCSEQIGGPEYVYLKVLPRGYWIEFVGWAEVCRLAKHHSCRGRLLWTTSVCLVSPFFGIATTFWYVLAISKKMSSSG